MRSPRASCAPQGAELTEPQRRAVAEYVTAKAFTGGSASLGKCATTPAFTPGQGPAWNSWRQWTSPTRVFSRGHRRASRAEQAPKLTLKWVGSGPKESTARAQPTHLGGHLFVGNQNGEVYALNPKSGCTIWTFKAEAAGAHRHAWSGPKPGDGGSLAYFGDQARVQRHAIDASTGTKVWMTRLDGDPNALITGTPALRAGRGPRVVAGSRRGAPVDGRRCGW